jgi:hypothetical protein
MAENRDLKKQVSQKQGARNDEILDREVSLARGGLPINHICSRLVGSLESDHSFEDGADQGEGKVGVTRVYSAYTGRLR